jgi:hypothetical protein
MMAGVRQHVLPRLLLKGFASRTASNEVFTFVYRKGKDAFETNIINVAVEKYFYGKDGELSADNGITDLEGRLSSLIDELRRQNDGVQIEDSRVIDLVAHICVRTKYLRDSFRESSEFLLETISSYLSNYNNVKALLLNNPKILDEAIDKSMNDYPIPPSLKKMLTIMMKNMVPVILDEKQSEIQLMFQFLTEMMKSMVPKALKQGHIKVLAHNPIPEPRAEDYKTLRWFIHKPQNSVILGDNGVLFETSGSKRFKSINEKGDEIKNIFLPVSSTNLLVGTHYAFPLPFDFDLNKAIAKCSRDYFISSEQSLTIESLHSIIGLESELISKEELEQVVVEALDDHNRS